MNLRTPNLVRLAAVALLLFFAAACGRVRVGDGAESKLREKNSYQERVNPKAPSERQPETLPIMEVDLDQPAPPSKKKSEKSAKPAKKSEPATKSEPTEKSEPSQK